MITLRAKLVGDQWMVSNEGYEGAGGQLYNDPSTPRTMEQVRAELFALVDPKYSGVFTLEWQPDELRAMRLAEITERTRMLLKQGFTYGEGDAGMRYASDAGAQAYYNLLRHLAGGTLDASLDYPVVIASLDEQGDLTLGDEQALAAFLGAEASHVRSARDGDVALKRRLREATSVAEIHAVIDER